MTSRWLQATADAARRVVATVRRCRRALCIAATHGERMKHVILLAFLAACHASRPTTPPDPHETIVTNLVGVWSGAAEATPYGGFRMALDFDRRPDGSVHTRFDGGSGMYLDFVFHRRNGSWVLTEEGVIPNVGVQKHTLTPAPGGEWVDGELRVALAMTGDAMVWTTTNHGTPHSVFRLHKAHGPAVEQIRQAIAKGPK
jgi:hypothetical protein